MKNRQKITNKFIQIVYNQVLNAPYEIQLKSLRAKIFDRLFQTILRFGDPLITYEIGGFTLLLPFSHKLPFILKTYPYYSSNLARIAKYVNQKYEALKFIDIGANIGDSVALLRKEAYFPILCIEGDRQFLSVLEKNTKFFPDTYMSQEYVGEVSENIKAVISKQCGTASLREGDVLENFIKIKTLPEVLENHPIFLESKMIKIDTDGFDGKILKGALNFLIKAKPIIFFEYDPFFLAQQGDDGISLFKILSNIGYRKMLVYDNFGDLMFSTEIGNWEFLQELHLYLSGRKGHFYCDICVFNTEDTDLFETARSQEILFFEKIKGLS